MKDENVTRFLNVDLDLLAKQDLTELVQAFEPGASALHCTSAEEADRRLEDTAGCGQSGRDPDAPGDAPVHHRDDRVGDQRADGTEGRLLAGGGSGSQEALAAAIGKTRIDLSAEQRRRLALKGKELTAEERRTCCHHQGIGSQSSGRSHRRATTTRHSA
jgi:hypothetical protein